MRQRRPITLIVDTDPLVVSQLRSISASAGYHPVGYSGSGHFEAARRHLFVQSPAALVANVRLGAFNGIHLAYLAKSADPTVRVMLYAEPHDALLANDVQRAGAFYERQIRAPHTLKRFLYAALPPSDRRMPDGLDRRRNFREGRRVSDIVSLHGQGTA